MIRLAGEFGIVLVAGRPALWLGPWTAHSAGASGGGVGGWQIEGQVARADAHWSEYLSRCDVALQIGDRWYRWHAAAGVLNGPAVTLVAQGQPEIDTAKE